MVSKYRWILYIRRYIELKKILRIKTNQLYIFISIVKFALIFELYIDGLTSKYLAKENTLNIY